MITQDEVPLNFLMENTEMISFIVGVVVGYAAGHFFGPQIAAVLAKLVPTKK